MRPPCVRRPRTRSTTSSPARSAPPDAPAERAVPDHLLCSICVEALEDPVLHPCGNAHCFCRECLECVAATAADAAAAAYHPRADRDRDRDRDPGDVDIACPLCRAPGAFSRVVPATAVAAQLAACAATCGACGEAVRLSAFKQHGRECASRDEAERRSRVSARERWRRYVRGALERTRTGDGSASGGGVANRRSSTTYVNRETFACPLCVAAGAAETDDHPGCHLDPIALLRHLETYHHDDADDSLDSLDSLEDDDDDDDDDDDASSIGEAGEGGRVPRVRRARPFAAVCPVCVSMPWGDPTRVCRDLEAHIRLRHRFDVARFADVEADEEEAVRVAMRRSAAEAGVADAGDAGDAGDVVPAGSEVVHTESDETSSSAEEDGDDADAA